MNGMSDEIIKEMLLKIIEEIDYDIYKDYIREEVMCLEEPLQPLIKIVKKYIVSPTQL